MNSLTRLDEELHCWLIGFVKPQHKRCRVDLVDVFYSRIFNGLIKFVDYGCDVEACHFSFQTVSFAPLDVEDTGLLL